MSKKQWTGLLYLAPVLILIIAFFLYPSISIIRTSFYTTKYGINFDFAGLKNYKIIFQDEVFRASLINSLKWTVSGMFLQLIIPLGSESARARQFTSRYPPSALSRDPPARSPTNR
jgi:ABC-type sugar transport system permease subunit